MVQLKKLHTKFTQKKLISTERNDINIDSNVGRTKIHFYGQLSSVRKEQKYSLVSKTVCHWLFFDI